MLAAKKTNANAWRFAFRQAKGIGSMARLVGWHAASYANKTGGSIFPGEARLAVELEVTDRTVRRALDTLRRAGWLYRESHQKGRPGDSGGRLADVYLLTVPVWVELPSEQQAAPEEDDEGPFDSPTASPSFDQARRTYRTVEAG